MTEYEIISTLVFAYITVLLLYLNRKQRRELMKLLKDTCDKDTKTLTDIRGRVNALVKERDDYKRKYNGCVERGTELVKERDALQKKLNNIDINSKMAADEVESMRVEIKALEKKLQAEKNQSSNFESLLKQAQRKLAFLSVSNKDIKIDEYDTKQEEIEELLKQNDKILIAAAEKYGLTPIIGQDKKTAKSAPCVYIISVLDKTFVVRSYGGETKDPNSRWADNFAKYGSEFRDAIKDAGDNIRVIWATGDCLKDNKKRKEIESFIIELGDFVNNGFNKRGGSVNIKDKDYSHIPLMLATGRYDADKHIKMIESVIDDLVNADFSSTNIDKVKVKPYLPIEDEDASINYTIINKDIDDDTCKIYLSKAEEMYNYIIDNNKYGEYYNKCMKELEKIFGRSLVFFVSDTEINPNKLFIEEDIFSLLILKDYINYYKSIEKERPITVGDIKNHRIVIGGTDKEFLIKRNQYLNNEITIYEFYRYCIKGFEYYDKEANADKDKAERKIRNNRIKEAKRLGLGAMHFKFGEPK